MKISWIAAVWRGGSSARVFERLKDYFKPVVGVHGCAGTAPALLSAGLRSGSERRARFVGVFRSAAR
jgi:hypothetical protein